MKRQGLLRILLLITGVLLVIVGITEKDFSDVFLKATKICLECIGIG